MPGLTEDSYICTLTRRNFLRNDFKNKIVVNNISNKINNFAAMEVSNDLFKKKNIYKLLNYMLGL